MEYESNENQGSFLDRIKESPRTVSAIIMILIVAAAIYAFSGQQNQTDTGSTTEETEEMAADESPTETAAITPALATATPAPKQAMMTPVTPVNQSQLQAIAADLPAAEKTEQGYVEKAQPGDGLTHLARRAATRYLAENNPGFTVTNEHRIYIEDYIKDSMAGEKTKIGATKTISTDLIKEAAEASSKLTDRQLQNLSKYTSALK